MPRCEGRPDQACPQKRNDSSVRSTQGDLFLCPVCEEFRFPSTSPDSKRSGKGKQYTKKNKTVTVAANAKSLLEIGGEAMASSTPAAARKSPNSDIIVDELLAYVCFYRDRCTTTYLHKVLVSFFHQAEIGEAKRKLIETFSARLNDCNLTVTRRQSTSRTVHDAEAEDILGIFDVLDNSDALGSVQFVAAALDRIPRFSPEDLNDYSIVEKQSQLEARVTDLAGTVSDSVKQQIQLDISVADLASSITGSVKQLQDQMSAFQVKMQQQLDTAMEIVQTSGQSAHPVKHKIEPDRYLNIVMFDIRENRDQTVWRSEVDKILKMITDRDIAVADGIRLGGRFVPDSDKVRPVLVKLQSAWDRRLVLASAYKLSSSTEYRGTVFIKPDQSLAVRRQSLLKRLKERAVNDGKAVTEQDGCLFVDGTRVFSVSDGFIKQHNVSTTGVSAM